MRRRRRPVVVVDRVLLTFCGLVLAGIALVIAGSGAVRELPDRLDMAQPESWLDASWWPAATAATGIVLVVLALWWWIAHLPGKRPGPMRLSGSAPSARLEVDLPAVAKAASRQASALPLVRNARIALIREHGDLVLVGDVRVNPHAPLATVAEDLKTIAVQTGQVLGRDSLAARIHLAVSRRTTGRRRNPPQ